MIDDETLDAIADRVVSRIGITIPNEIKESIRVNTTQTVALNYIAKNEIWFPQLRLDFSETGVWMRWEWPNGNVSSVHFFPWGTA